jgi:nitrite reductase/ring-hydroxylating ferredoxin subunit
MKTFILGHSKEEVLRLVPDNSIRLIQLGQQKICLTRQGESIFGFEALCPHRRASLAQGFITPFFEVVCPLHQYRFDIRTGSLRSGDCGDLQVFATDLSDSGLKIFLPDQ